MRLLIALVSLAALGAVVAAIVVGTRSFDGTVVDQPYEKGIQWDATRKERESSGWKVGIETNPLKQGDNQVIVRVLDGNGRPLNNAEITVNVIRPGTVSYDRTYAAKRLANGRFGSTIAFPLHGHWDLTITVKRQGASISFDESVIVLPQ